MLCQTLHRLICMDSIINRQNNNIKQNEAANKAVNAVLQVSLLHFAINFLNPKLTYSTVSLLHKDFYHLRIP